MLFCQCSILSHAVFLLFSPSKQNLKWAAKPSEKLGPGWTNILCAQAQCSIDLCIFLTFKAHVSCLEDGPRATWFACRTSGCCHSCSHVVFITSPVSMAPCIVLCGALCWVSGQEQTSHPLVKVSPSDGRCCIHIQILGCGINGRKYAQFMVQLQNLMNLLKRWWAHGIYKCSIINSFDGFWVFPCHWLYFLCCLFSCSQRSHLSSY